MWLLLFALYATSPTDTINTTRAALLRRLPVETRQRIHDFSRHLDPEHYEVSAHRVAQAAFPAATASELNDYAFLIMADAEEKTERDLTRVKHEVENLEMQKSMIRDEMAKKRIDQSQLDHDMGAVEAAEQLQKARIPGLSDRRQHQLEALLHLLDARK